MQFRSVASTVRQQVQALNKKPYSFKIKLLQSGVATKSQRGYFLKFLGPDQGKKLLVTKGKSQKTTLSIEIESKTMQKVYFSSPNFISGYADFVATSKNGCSYCFAEINVVR